MKYACGKGFSKISLIYSKKKLSTISEYELRILSIFPRSKYQFKRKNHLCKSVQSVVEKVIHNMIF